MAQILYIYISSNLKATSINQKILNQIRFLNGDGVTCRGAFFTSEISEDSSYNENVDLIAVRVKRRRYFHRHYRRRKVDQVILKYLAENEGKYDVIYFRYPGASRGLLEVTRRYRKVVFEINGNLPYVIGKERGEISLRPSALIRLFDSYIIPIQKEAIYGRRIFQEAKVVCSVSHELFRIYKNWYRAPGLDAIVVGNGISVSQIPVRSVTSNERSGEMRMILLKGASTEADYLGIDRLLKGLRDYKGGRRIKLIAAGKKYEKEQEMVREFGLDAIVDFIGYVEEREISKIIDQCHIAIGSLAVHRSNISEISSLKTREYLSRGIPFVIGYEDTDLRESSRASEFFYTVPFDETPINIEKLIEFSDRVNANMDHASVMHKLAEETVDFAPKMKFLREQLLARHEKV